MKVDALWPEGDSARPDAALLARVMREWGAETLPALRERLGIDPGDRFGDARARAYLECACRGQELDARGRLQSRPFTARELVDEVASGDARERLIAALERGGMRAAADRMRKPGCLTQSLPVFDRERLDVEFEHLQRIDDFEALHNAPMSVEHRQWLTDNVLDPLRQRSRGKAAVQSAQTKRHDRAAPAIAARNEELKKLMLDLLCAGTDEAAILQRAKERDDKIVAGSDNIRPLALSGLRTRLRAAKKAKKKSKP